VLSGEGFDAYEVSNHARGEGGRSRHNLVYWRGQDYVGVGPGAHGRLTLDGTRTATVAEARVEAYVRAVAETGRGWTSAEALSAREAAEERLLMGLRTTEGVRFEDVEALGLRPDSPIVRDMAEDGLLASDPERLVATPAGRLVLDRLTSELAMSGEPMAVAAPAR
jgi:oxygen-independent coproporphyrinogen-3 oxidase